MLQLFDIQYSSMTRTCASKSTETTSIATRQWLEGGDTGSLELDCQRPCPELQEIGFPRSSVTLEDRSNAEYWSIMMNVLSICTQMNSFDTKNINSSTGIRGKMVNYIEKQDMGDYAFLEFYGLSLQSVKDQLSSYTDVTMNITVKCRGSMKREHGTY